MNAQNKETIVITGSNGRIGLVLVPAFEETYNVIRIDKTDTEHSIDIIEADALYNALQDQGSITCIIHLAASSSLHSSWEDAVRNNILGTHNVYETARRLAIPRVIFASSCEVTRGYEKRRLFSKYVTTKKPISEDLPTATCSPYGVSKVAGEHIARHYEQVHGINSICLRIGVVAPNDQPGSVRSHQLWLSYRDTIHAFECALAAPQSFGVYNVTSDNDRRFVDLTRAKKELNYNPHDNAFKKS